MLLSLRATLKPTTTTTSWRSTAILWRATATATPTAATFMAGRGIDDVNGARNASIHGRN